MWRLRVFLTVETWDVWCLTLVCAFLGGLSVSIKPQISSSLESLPSRDEAMEQLMARPLLQRAALSFGGSSLFVEARTLGIRKVEVSHISAIVELRGYPIHEKAPSRAQTPG
jgi:hypothetical protein